MKNIFKIFSSENLKKNLKNIWDRFPVAIIIILLLAGLLFIELHYNSDISNYYNERIFIAILVLIMTFVFSVWTYLSSENSDKSKLQRNLFQFIPLWFWVIFYNVFSLDPNDFENILFFILSFTGIIAFLFFAPYFKNLFKKPVQQSVFYTYFYNISGLILISFIFAWVLFGLGAIGIAATDALFDLDINEKNTYWNWAILSLSIIAPLFFLTQIPTKKSFKENNFNENAFFSFLIKFVAIPFIYLYFFILYAYTIKVLSNFSDWPKGEVSWLVIGFSIFGYIAYIFSYIFEEKNKLIKGFRKIFPWAVIPQIFMLFYAIYLRINQYDLTVNRYFVVVFGLWLLLTSLHFIFSKKKNLIAIPAWLALFIIIISIIPKYNVYSFPEERQSTRLEFNLIKATILQDWKIVGLNNYSDISEDLSKNIYSGINYLCDFHNCESIKKLFSVIYQDIYDKDKANWEKYREENIKRYKDAIIKYKDSDLQRVENNEKILKRTLKEKYEWPSKWEITQWIIEKIKVKNYFSKSDDNRKYFEYNKDYKDDFFPINTKWYSKIYRIQTYNQWGEVKNYAEYNMKNQEIIIRENDIEIIKFSTKEISKKLIEKFSKNDNNDLKKQELIFELESGKYRLYFENISILNPDYKEADDENIEFWWYSNWYLLVK